MKKLLNILYAFLFLSIGLVSCTDDDMETDKGESPLTLSASTNTVILDQRLEANQALSLTWESGSNKGTGAAIIYTFQMDLKGNNFQGGINKEIGKTDSRVITYTHKELNDSLVKIWNLPLEVEAEFEVRVLAKVMASGFEKMISNVVDIKVTSYKERYINLYMIGNATPSGWDNQRALAMTSIEEEKGGFEWRGQLKAGDMKFITKLGSFDNYFSKGLDDNTLIFNDPQDDKFVIPQNGTYKIKLNIETLAIDIQMEPGTATPYQQMWMMGSATSGGWSADNGTEMTHTGGGKFTWQGTLRNGEFKFIAVPGYFAPSFGKGADDQTLKLRLSDGESDENFSIATAATYKVDIDTEALTISVTQIGNPAISDNVWIIGDASPGGWSWDNITALVRSEDDINEFTYEGHLNTGEFKFPIERDDSWGGKFVVALVNNQPLNETGCQIAAGIDNKWKITDAGTYKIVIHLKNNTIHITKNGTRSGDYTGDLSGYENGSF